MSTKLTLCVLFSFASCIAEAAETNQPVAVSGSDITGRGAITANTVESDPPIFKFGGFGSVGAAHSSQGLGDYVIDSTLPKGPGRSYNWSFDNDSRIGAQVVATFTPKLSAILQVVSDYQADNTYNPGIEWANVKYAITPDAYIRIGRIALPTFLNSDHRDVGYSYPWVHPPVDLYRQLVITHSDGVDAMYRFDIAGLMNSIKVIYGKNTLNQQTSISTSEDMWGIFNTLEYDSTTIRFGYQERKSASYSLLTGITGAWIPNSDFSAGVNYDPGNWFVMSEWIQRESTTKSSAMYVSSGYRIDKFTPYLTYSRNSAASFIPGFPAPTATTTQNAYRSQSTVSMGVRWDFMRNTDFKLQYDQVRLSDNSNGYLANLPAGVILYGNRFHVISAVVDFVF